MEEEGEREREGRGRGRSIYLMGLGWSRHYKCSIGRWIVKWLHLSGRLAPKKNVIYVAEFEG